MRHRIETTDPITGNDIEDLYGKPYVVEGAGTPNDLVIYFESEDSREQYLAGQGEHPHDHHGSLDGPEQGRGQTMPPKT